MTGIGAPPAGDDVKQLRDWCERLYQWLLYPDKFETQFIELQEITAPSAPGANRVRIYCVDSTGKTKLVALFNSGAAQQIAIEP